MSFCTNGRPWVSCVITHKSLFTDAQAEYKTVKNDIFKSLHHVTYLSLLLTVFTSWILSRILCVLAEPDCSQLHDKSVSAILSLMQVSMRSNCLSGTCRCTLYLNALSLNHKGFDGELGCC